MARPQEQIWASNLPVGCYTTNFTGTGKRWGQWAQWDQCQWDPSPQVTHGENQSAAEDLYHSIPFYT